MESQLFGIEFINDSKLLPQIALDKVNFFRKHYCLPNCITLPLIRLTFFSTYPMTFKVRSTLGLLFRLAEVKGSAVVPAFQFERSVAFPRGIGFSADLKKILSPLGKEDWVLGSSEAFRDVVSFSNDFRIEDWSACESSASTSFLCEFFIDPSNLRGCIFHVSDISVFAVRVFLLTWTGNFCFLMEKSRKCCKFCLLQTLTTEHIFSCPFLQINQKHSFYNSTIEEVTRLTFISYFARVPFERVSPFSHEECILFETL